MKSSIFCLSLLIIVPAMAQGQQSHTVDLLILAGQSNMIGRAPATASVPGLTPIDNLVDYYYDLEGGAFGVSNSGGEFVELAPWQRSSGGHEFGPEISLGRTLAADPNRNLAIVKVAVGGTDIAQWLPGKGQYNRLQMGVRNGIEAIQQAGNDIHVLGFTWMQGEHDAIDSSRASKYGDHLNTLVSGFRSEMESEFPSLGFQDARVFLVEPGEWTDGRATTENSALVDRALADYAKSDPRAWFIPTSDFDEYVDSIHLNAGDQLTLGTRIAYRVLGLDESPIVVGGYRSIGRESHWDDINVAPAGTAIQSSDHNDSTTAANAVDGNMRSMARTSTDQKNHWWQLELPESTAINQINIVNGARRGRYLTNGGGFRAEILRPSGEIAWEQDFVGTDVDEDILSIQPSQAPTGSVVRLSKLNPVSTGSAGAFRLREVELIADASSFEMAESDTWYFEIDADDDVADSVAIAGRLDIKNAQLVVTLIDGDLEVGDRFDILDFEETTGQFGNIHLPNLADDLQWYSADLYEDGALTVVHRGDFNKSGMLDAADIDLLSSQVRESSTDLLYDLSGDKVVDFVDHLHWVERVAGTLLGDSDLDGTVQFSDFVALSSNFDQPGGWHQGDFDGNGIVEFSDFLALSENFGQGPNVVAAAVPEPAGATVAFLSTLGLLGVYRRANHGLSSKKVELICAHHEAK